MSLEIMFPTLARALNPHILQFMTPFIVVSILLGIAALSGFTCLMLIGPAQPAPSAAAEPAAPLPETPPPTGIIAWMRANPAETALGLTLALAGLYTATFFPKSATLTLPGDFGRPLAGFRFILDMVRQSTSWWPPVITFVATLTSLALTASALRQRANRQRAAATARLSLLIAGFGMVGVAQLALFDKFDPLGAYLYAPAFLVFIVWGWAYQPYLADDLVAGDWSRRREAAFLALALGVTAIVRLYLVGDIPYGIEGDESKWTVEVAASMVDGRFPDAAMMHLNFTPLSFYMQAPFHLIFGPTIASARITVALYSIAGSAFFYLLARHIAGRRVAWLATILLGVSIFDISASRLANVESFVKLWPPLALLLLAWALRNGRPAAFALAGVVLAAAMLTYETTWPLAGVVVCVLALEFWRQRPPFADAVRRLSAFALPLLLIFPIGLAYFAGRIDYYLLYVPDPTQPTTTHERLWVSLVEMLKSLFVQTYPDFLYNRLGPLFNSLLLPWLTLGFALALVAWRIRRIAWMLILFTLFFFVAPVVFHAAFGRTFYAALPAAYFLMALGSVACYAELKRVLGPALQPALRTIAIVAICFVGLGNLYIYFNEVDDPYDRVMRREIMEIARSVEDPALLALYPYFAEAGEPFEFEREYLIALGHRLSSSGTSNTTPYRALTMEQLLPTLAAPPAGIERAMVVWWNWDNLPRHEERLAILAQLQTCYPAMTHLSGLHFDRYIIPDLQPGAPCVAGFVLNAP